MQIFIWQNGKPQFIATVYSKEDTNNFKTLNTKVYFKTTHTHTHSYHCYTCFAVLQYILLLLVSNVFSNVLMFEEMYIYVMIANFIFKKNNFTK